MSIPETELISSIGSVMARVPGSIVAEKGLNSYAAMNDCNKGVPLVMGRVSFFPTKRSTVSCVITSWLTYSRGTERITNTAKSNVSPIIKSRTGTTT